MASPRSEHLNRGGGPTANESLDSRSERNSRRARRTAGASPRRGAARGSGARLAARRRGSRRGVARRRGGREPSPPSPLPRTPPRRGAPPPKTSTKNWPDAKTKPRAREDLWFPLSRRCECGRKGQGVRVREAGLTHPLPPRSRPLPFDFQSILDVSDAEVGPQARIELSGSRGGGCSRGGGRRFRGDRLDLVLRPGTSKRAAHGTCRRRGLLDAHRSLRRKASAAGCQSVTVARKTTRLRSSRGVRLPPPSRGAWPRPGGKPRCGTGSGVLLGRIAAPSRFPPHHRGVGTIVISAAPPAVVGDSMRCSRAR